MVIEMCEYCKFEENGDTADGYEPVVDSGQFPISFDTEVKTDSLIADLHLQRNFAIQSGVDSDSNLYEFIFDTSAECDFHRVFRQKINYCPMCGRKLEAVQDED